MTKTASYFTLLGGCSTALARKMRPVATDGVAWSVHWFVCLSLMVTTVSPAKVAEPIMMPFGMLTWAAPMNCVLDGGPDPHAKGEILREWRQGFPVKQHSDWSATEAVECHIKFSQNEKSFVIRPLVKIVWPLVIVKTTLTEDWSIYFCYNKIEVLCKEHLTTAHKRHINHLSHDFLKKCGCFGPCCMGTIL